MSKTLIDIVKRLNKTRLAEMWCDFNCFEWPTCLPVAHKPVWWDREDLEFSVTRERKYGFNEPFMKYAKTVCGENFVMEAWRRLKCAAAARPSSAQRGTHAHPQ